jgi:hypothetical protein
MCCGNKRVQMRTSFHDGHIGRDSHPIASRSVPFVPFVNLGKNKLTVIGPVTGKRYHFATLGSQVQVDVRDQSMLARLRQLRLVR